MSIIPHVVVGAAVGSFFGNPALAGLGGFFSHFGLDLIPHYDPEIRAWEVMTVREKFFVLGSILVELAFLVTFLFFTRVDLNLFWGGLMGVLPDVDNFLQYKFPKVFPLLSRIGLTIHKEGSVWHKKLKYKPEWLNLMLGVVLQLLVCGAGVLIIWGYLWRLAGFSS